MGMTLLIDRLDDDLRRSFGLSLTEYEILVRLSEADDRRMRMAQLADALAHSRSRVTHTVARMEKAGLVARSATPEDGRGIVVRDDRQGLRPAGPDGARPTSRASATTSSTWSAPRTSAPSAG